ALPGTRPWPQPVSRGGRRPAAGLAPAARRLPGIPFSCPRRPRGPPGQEPRGPAVPPHPVRRGPPGETSLVQNGGVLRVPVSPPRLPVARLGERRRGAAGGARLRRG